MKNDYTVVINDLLGQGYATLSMDLSSIMPFVFKEFGRLTEEPDAFRQKWLIDRSAFRNPEQGPDDGLMVTKGEINPFNGDRFDNKFKLQIKRDVPTILKYRNAVGGYQDFLDACMVVHEKCVHTMFDLAKELDKMFPGFKFLDLMNTNNAMGLHTLRLLSYDRPSVTEGDIVAAKHVDRDGFTLHLDESRPGLCIIPTSTGVEIPYIPNKGEVLVFPGGKAPLFKPRFEALDHLVRDREATTAEKRRSAVFFGHTDTPVAPEFLVTCKR